MQQRQQLFYSHLAQTSDFPLALDIERAEGVYLYDTKGKKYIDFISGIGVSNVGHRHPKVVEAIHNQVDKYLHLMVYGEYIQSPQVLLAAALTSPPSPLSFQERGSIEKDITSSIENAIGESANSPSPVRRGGWGERWPPLRLNAYLTNSGTEAVEGAMKLAKRFTGRSQIISCKNAYHGSTQGALSLAGAEFFKQNFRPLLPDIRHIQHGVLEDLEHITHQTAAVVIEVIQGEAGVRVPTNEYHQALRQRCTEVGALLIFDEIQTGFGRTGTFWAFEQFDTYPDILLCAKGMGGGMPIGAFIAPQEIMSVFKNNPILGHITTFGGHPVSAAASLATLQVVQEQHLAQKAIDKGLLIRSLLKHSSIKEIRGRGLMLAAEFESFEVLKPIIDRAIEKGIITDWFLFCDNSMRIAPPLTITEEEIRLSCEIILDAI